MARTVRLFLSSTFRDFGEERDLLVKRVFPALRARLKNRFVELVDVDLRWGITAEDAERGEVLPICLAEIDRARPFFIGMLGERYGWIPPAGGFAVELLERHPWLKKYRGGKSVTELEILHGVLNSRRMLGRAFFYFRSPSYARAMGGDYLPSVEDRARQTELKRRIRERGLPVTAYANPEALAKRIERDLWKLLDAEFPASEVPDAFEREQLRHEAYAAPRRRLFLGGERYKAALDKALAAEEPRIVVEGDSGGGKSALLANFIEGYRKRHPRHFVHEHYLSASTDAADPNALVRRLIEFVQRATNSHEDIPGEPQKLMDSLPLWLATASAWARRRKTRFIFVLDSLNSLTDQQDLRWWPKFLPKGVTMLVSCLLGQVRDELRGKVESPPGQGKSPLWKTVTILPLTKAQSATLINTYLARFNKKLPGSMIKQVQAHPLATNPLFVLTLAEELRLFGVHEALQKRLGHYLCSQTIDDLFERVLQRVEKDCGEKKVKAAMTAIWASRSGLMEEEIRNIVGLTPAAWAAIRYALDEALLDADGKITFAHEYVRLAVRDRCLGTVISQQRAHRHLGKWFNQQPLDDRRAEEEPYQWEASGAVRALIRSLTDKEMFLFLFGHRPDELRKYWVTAAAQVNLSAAYLRAWRRWNIVSVGNEDGAIEAYLSLFLVSTGSTGQFAETMARESLKKTITVLGESSREAGLRRGDLATLLKNRGRYSEAEGLYRDIARSRCFERSDRDRARNLVNLGLVLKLAGDLDGAKAAYYSAERIFKKSQPSSVLQDLARLENNIAALLAQQGANSRAIYLYHSALEKLIRVFGQASQEVGIVRSNLASVLLDNRRYDEAAQLLAPALDKALMAMGRMHSDTAHIANNLASAKYYLGDFEGALEPASLALGANRASIGVENPQTIISALNFATILIKLDLSDRAAAVLSEVVIEAERLWASPKAALVPIIKLAANMLERLGRKEIAMSMLRQFLLAARGRDYQEVVDLHDAILIK